MKFTGERYVPSLDGEIKYTHVHRYAVCHDFIAGKRVLDVASGEGYGAALLAKCAASVVGVDLDPAAVAHAERAYKAHQNLEFRIGFCEVIPLADASIDVVTSFETLEHHDKHVEMMREIKRVLRPGGTLIISSPNRPLYSEKFQLVNPFHVKELDQQELVRLLEDHFRFVKLYGHQLAAGSFVFPLGESAEKSFAAYAGNSALVSRKTASLSNPQFFIAICSDQEIPTTGGVESIYLDPNEDLLQTMHDELCGMRANYLRDSAMLEEIRSSLTLRVMWLSRKLIPRPVRVSIKAVLKQAKRVLNSGIASRLVPGSIHTRLSALGGQAPAHDVSPGVDFIPQKIAPLKLKVLSGARRRINLLMSIVNFQYFFAGCMCMFNLALHLKRYGHNVRVIIVDPCDYDPSRWKREIADYDGLHTFFDEVEVAYMVNRGASLKVSPSDVFVATSWWTAHIAHHATRELGRDKFIYLIQEYEPLFHPAGSLFALAEQAYMFPHHAIFSTEVLRDYFRQRRVGVFAGNNENQGTNAIVIRNAANTFQVTEADLRSRSRKRLLFYARPEQANNARNAFELGVLAIREVIKEAHFDPESWDFHGIGGMANYQDVPLHGGANLKMLPGVSLPEFLKLLPEYDLGLSLMLTPHPSLMPLDMAAAGLVTVTNTYANKTRETMAAVSHNIIAVPPTIEDLKYGLITALREVDNFDKRLTGTKLNWPTSWDETFSPEVMSQINQYVDCPAQISGVAPGSLKATTMS